MVNHNLEHKTVAVKPGSLWTGLLAGLLIGSSAGAVAMLMLAPYSGKRTRAKIQRQGHELREQATESVEDAVTLVRGKARQITHDVRRKADVLEQRGQAVLDEQKGNLITLVEAGKNAVQGSGASPAA